MGLDIFITRKTRASKEVGYFRKVNFLVKFFEDRGFDTPTQTPIDIKKEWAIELLDRCNKVLDNHNLAKELLPTMDGFFFGDTNYDDDYFEDVKEVRDWCKDTLIPTFEELRDNEYLEFSTWY